MSNSSIYQIISPEMSNEWCNIVSSLINISYEGGLIGEQAGGAAGEEAGW